jgi:glycosyltransferase involved in cell wall biosynthesis
MYIAELNLLKHAAAVQYTSEEEQRQAEDLGFAHRGVVVPNAVDLEAAAGANDVSSRNCYSESRGRATILFVGRLHPVKGVDLLLTAFARAADRHPQATLAILGSGAADYEERLKAMAVTLGIASKVLWLGFRTGQEKWAALAASDLVVLPSHSENFGIAAAEAMACGRPVLVTEGVGIHALVSQAEAGVVCSADAGSLAAGLDQLLASLQLRRRMGANGRRLAATEFSTRAVCARILDLYRSAVA